MRGWIAILNDSQPTPTPETANIPNPLSRFNNIVDMASHPTNPGASIPPIVSPSSTLPTIPSMSTEPPPPPLQVKLLSSTAKPPSRSSAFAAGYDLYASREAVVPAWGKVLVDTDISIAVPANSYGRVAPRSGLAVKHCIHTGAGVIDADYRGPVKVLLFNLSSDEFTVAAGDRIAQLVVERVSLPYLADPN